MAYAKDRQRKPQLVCTAVACVAVLTHVLACSVQPSLAATSTSQQQQHGESGPTAAASTQPLWSYQVKPGGNYGVGVGQGAPQNNPYSGLGGPASLFDAFTGLSQRQGALTQGSPFLSILPIILIAAGGLLLLLPMLTMMMASPFGGGAFGGGGGYQNYGYPQVSGLNKRRSLDSLAGGSLHKTGLIELIEHVSSTIEDLSRKYAPNAPGAAAAAAASAAASASSQQASHATVHKRSAKALNSGSGGSGGANNLAANHQPANELSQAAPANHKPGDDATNPSNGLSNLVGGSL